MNFSLNVKEDLLTSIVKKLGRITNPTYLNESNEELALIKDAYSSLNKII